jgi:hypothetical protein
MYGDGRGTAGDHLPMSILWLSRHREKRTSKAKNRFERQMFVHGRLTKRSGHLSNKGAGAMKASDLEASLSKIYSELLMSKTAVQIRRDL